MEQMKRAQLLQQDEQTKSLQELAAQLSLDKLQLEADLVETKSALSRSEQKVLRLKSADILSPTEIVNGMGEIEGFKAGLKALNDLKKELF